MIKIEVNNKSQAQLRLEEKLERDKKRLQEQVKKVHRKIEELKKKARGCIGDMFAEHLPDFYCFDGDELKEIIDTAMSQKAVKDKISEIRKRPDRTDDSGKDNNAIETSMSEHTTSGSSEDEPAVADISQVEYKPEIEENSDFESNYDEEE